MQIWSLSHHYSCRYIVYDAALEEQCQTFNYTSPESPTNNFSVNLYTWSRPNLNKKMVVTSCKYGAYRIGIHADILYTTQASKNNVKLSIIPHPNRPTHHFSVNLYTWSRPNLNKKMVVTSCKYGLYRIITHADILYTTQAFEEQCQTFNYTSPESPTNHFSVNLYTWSRPNLNKKKVVTSCKYSLYRIRIHADILYTTQALKNNVKLSITPHPNRPRIIFPSTFIHGHVQIWIRKW